MVVPWCHGTMYHDFQEKINILAPELFSLNFGVFLCFWSPFGPPCLYPGYFDKFPARNFNTNLFRGTVKSLVEFKNFKKSGKK